MGSEIENRSNEIINQNPEVNNQEVEKIQIVNENSLDFDDSSSTSLSSSSSSSSISSNDPNTVEELNFNDISSPESQILSPDCISSPDITAPVTPQWSMESASPPDNNPPAKFKPTTPHQTNGSSYDPNRIPTSIFSTKPSNPMDWSTASNESLFSIQMGNNSFSQDHSIMFGKPGEISWLDEWNLPPVMEVPAYYETSMKSVRVDSLEKNDTEKIVKVVTEHCHVKEEKMTRDEISTDFAVTALHECGILTTSSSRTSSKTRLSNDSGNSGSSFAFPVFVDGGKNGSFINERHEQPKSEAKVYESPRKHSKMRLCCSCFTRWPHCC